MRFPLIITVAALLVTSLPAVAGMDEDVLSIQQRWAQVNYATEKDAQDDAFKALTDNARLLVEKNPGKAEPLVWLAIIMSSDAGATGGLGALGKVKEARNLLEQAEQIDPEALNGSIYTSLGSLYYQVPRWPIGFGDKAKAEQYLLKALSTNPAGIDPNYFYGDYLLDRGKPAEAVQYLKKAQAAAPRPNRPLADQGRQREIAEKLKLATSKL